MPSGGAAKATPGIAAEQASPTSLSWPGPGGRAPCPTNAPHRVPAGPRRASWRVGRAAVGEVRPRQPCACDDEPLHDARGFGSETDSEWPGGPRTGAGAEGACRGWPPRCGCPPSAPAPRARLARARGRRPATHGGHAQGVRAPHGPPWPTTRCARRGRLPGRGRLESRLAASERIQPSAPKRDVSKRRRRGDGAREHGRERERRRGEHARQRVSHRVADSRDVHELVHRGETAHHPARVQGQFGHHQVQAGRW